MTTSLCELCGQPMHPDEQMFKYHGHSGPCPNPPLARDVEGDPVVDRTLAAYALNLMFGAELADFERDNLLALAAQAGVHVNGHHQALAAARAERRKHLAADLAERDELRATLVLCRDQFRRYEQLHSLKPDGSGQEKAKVNAEFAVMCEQALRIVRVPPDQMIQRAREQQA